MQSSYLTLGTEKVHKLLIQYSLPAIVAMTAASLYNMIDSIFIGQGVGAMAIAGLAITLPFMNIAAAVGSMVGIGASSLLSVKLGQKDYKSAEFILGNVVLMNVLVGGFFAGGSLLFLDEILLFFGASEVTLPYAHDFMVVILSGNIITHVYMGLNEMLRASGFPQKAMLATIFAVVINGVLCYIFIFIMDMGVRGAAVATICAQFLSLLFVVSHFLKKKNFIRFRRSIWAFKPYIIKGMLAIGLSPFLMNLCASFVVILINHSLKNLGGDMAIGAYGIVNRIALLFVMVNMGFNQGMQPIVGYNYGAQQLERVMKAFKYTVLCTTSVTSIGFIAAQFFPRPIIRLFTPDEELIEIAAVGLHYVLFMFPVVGFQMASGSFFQSIGIPKKAIFLSLTRQLIFLIPFLLILPHFFGLIGVWASIPAADTAAFINAFILVRLQMKKFKKGLQSG
ncbi:MATE family efflux transporter [Bacteroidia bacterium]|nr:MATE family efflux transporter [Bacteroidia bacterium]